MHFSYDKGGDLQGTPLAATHDGERAPTKVAAVCQISENAIILSAALSRVPFVLGRKRSQLEDPRRIYQASFLRIIMAALENPHLRNMRTRERGPINNPTDPHFTDVQLSTCRLQLDVQRRKIAWF